MGSIPIIRFLICLLGEIGKHDRLKICSFWVIGSSPIVSKKKIIFMKIQKQLKGKPCRKFGAFLWKTRTFTIKQEKAVSLANKKVNTKKLSNFALQLRAKQLVSALYGQLKLQHFKHLLQQSQKYRGKLAHIFFSLLEKRLDSCLVQLKFAPTFLAARQLINHKKVCINGNIITAPGVLLKPGDSVSFIPEIQTRVASNVQTACALHDSKKVLAYKPLHFEVNYKTLEAIFLFSPQQVHYPTRIEPELVLKALR
jgi:small subunit ribosomal protein S4